MNFKTRREEGRVLKRVYQEKCDATPASPCFSIVARGRGRERKDEGGSVMNGRIYFEDFKTRGDATREKSDVTENFTFLTFGYIYIYMDI